MLRLKRVEILKDTGGDEPEMVYSKCYINQYFDSKDYQKVTKYFTGTYQKRFPGCEINMIIIDETEVPES